MKNISISNYKINHFSRPLIAEISSNHKWSLKHTLNLIKIKQVGAHAVKIQTYDENSRPLSIKSIFLLKKDYGRNIIYLNCIRSKNSNRMA